MRANSQVKRVLYQTLHFFGKVFLFYLVNTEFKLSALGPSGSFVWVALYLYTPKKNESPFIGTVTWGGGYTGCGAGSATHRQTAK